MNHMRILADACVGTVIGGRYNVDKVLGCGGMGFVLAATHQLTSGRVALKMVPDAEGMSMDRLLLEARAPATIKHPNLVEVHDVGYDEAKKSYFLVQELLDGTDLRTHLEARGRLPWRESVSLLTPIMDALTAAHEAGIVHRDLKPENLFLAKERDGKVVPRVLDFGIARATNSKNRLTTVGGAIGTPNYMSPSSARGEMNVGAEGDVWSMGVILFELIAGYTPYDGDNYNAVMMAIVSTVAPRIDSVITNVPPEIADVIERALQHDRSRRFATMGDMMHALLDAARFVGPASSSVILPPSVTAADIRQMSTPPALSSPAPSPSAITDRHASITSRMWGPAAAVMAGIVLMSGLLFGVRAMGERQTPMVMRTISVQPEAVHYAAVAAPTVVPVAPVQARVTRRNPATRGRTQAPLAAQDAGVRPVTVAAQTHAQTTGRNGAPVFEP